MRVAFYTSCRRLASAAPKDTYDAIVIGGGHNGLTAAAYLARAGKRVCVLERRNVIGGAAVTEEILPGYKFSRASYLLSLLRPIVIEDLKLKEHGLRYHIRNPSSFTSVRESKKSLLLGLDLQENRREIGKFSKRDAEMFLKYEEFIERLVKPLGPMMDEVPLNPHHLSKSELIKKTWKMFQRVRQIGASNMLDFYELMTAPIAKIMDKWFESDVLKATLGTDGVLGFAASPYDVGTGYVLFQHVIGGVDGHSGAWAYVMDGMGAVSSAIAKSAQSHGAGIFVEQAVFNILLAIRYERKQLIFTSPKRNLQRQSQFYYFISEFFRFPDLCKICG